MGRLVLWTFCLVLSCDFAFVGGELLKKKTVAAYVMVVVAILTGIDAALAASAIHNNQLTFNLGAITAQPTASPSPSPTPTLTPSNVIITGGTLNGAQASGISTDGSTASFNDWLMPTGQNIDLVINIKNTGQTTAILSQPIIGGLSDTSTNTVVLSATTQNTYPLTIASGQTLTLTWTLNLIGVGTCHPTITIAST